jgi:hypothetical protein
MKCSKCGADTSDNSTSSLCPACIDAEGRFGKVAVFLGVAALFVVFIVFFLTLTPTKPNADSAGNPVPETASNAPASQPDTPQAPAAAPVPEKHDWDYDTGAMDAGSRPVKFGCIGSDEMVHLNSPYEDTFTRLCLRTDGAALFILNGDGQMLSGEGHGAIIRFGDGPAKRFSLEEPSDYSSKEAFVEPAGPLFAAARAGKSITIEATYYEAGQQVVTFSAATPLNLK